MKWKMFADKDIRSGFVVDSNRPIHTDMGGANLSIPYVLVPVCATDLLWALADCRRMEGRVFPEWETAEYGLGLLDPDRNYVFEVAIGTDTPGQVYTVFYEVTQTAAADLGEFYCMIPEQEEAKEIYRCLDEQTQGEISCLCKQLIEKVREET